MEKDNNIILEKSQSSDYYKNRSTSESENELENRLIQNLVSQGYEYAKEIKDFESLKHNLRIQIENLNNVKFNNDEWERLYKSYIDKTEDNTIKKTARIQKEDGFTSFSFDNSEERNIKLFDKKELHRNKLQVINQYRNNKNLDREAIYDVTILVNGLPLVHIELKRRSGALEEAFNQVKRYKYNNFSTDYGALFNYVQLFVISSGTFTKYFANTSKKLQDNNNSGLKTDFSFLNTWADINSNTIDDLEDFSKSFLTPHTILSVLFKYCVFNSADELLVMRPYQIAAVERINKKINYCIQNNQKENRNGYIWHTTGSGKTLTSFKTAQLLKDNNLISKVMFVVDRKDLDIQTIQEYSKFDSSFVESINSTSKLESKILSNKSSDKVIVTTIQKLDGFVKRQDNKKYSENIVIIFDECHRSQFGSMHNKIKSHFTNSFMYGFTGTPIFEENKHTYQIDQITTAHKKLDNSLVFTTEDIFSQMLHSYTIVQAIKDRKVLGFRYEELIPIKYKSDNPDSKVNDINTREIFESDLWVKENSKTILEKFNAKTQRKSLYSNKNIILDGFNSILTVSSTEMAYKYYNELRSMIKESKIDNISRLKVASIFSYSVNSKYTDEFLGTEEVIDNLESMETNQRDKLDKIIDNYNKDFNTNFSSNGNSFNEYYKDISQKVKDRKIDILIVVNMFLTGFDAKCVNTLWVDRELKYHGLIQAFSRTNRIYNGLKTVGNIVSFRKNKDNLDNALSLFGDNNAISIVLAKDYKDVYEEYKSICEKLKSMEDLASNSTESEKREFISYFKMLLRTSTTLLGDEQFSSKNMKQIDDIKLDNLTSKYKQFKKEINDLIDSSKESIFDDIVFETTSLQIVGINESYIIELIKKKMQELEDLLKDGHSLNSKAVQINKDTLIREIDLSDFSASRKELVKRFVERLFSFSDRINISSFMSLEKEIARKEIIEKYSIYNKENPSLVKEWIEGRLDNFYVDVEDNIIHYLGIKYSKTAEERDKIVSKFQEDLSIYKENFETQWIS